MILTAIYIEPADGHVLANTGPWRCFHCDELCETVEAATHHFGRHDGCTPICQVAAETYRAMEREVQSYRSESDADTVLFYSLGAKHSNALREAEQAGYDRGLADGQALTAQPQEPV